MNRPINAVRLVTAELARVVAEVFVDETLETHLLPFIAATRDDPDLVIGAGPRGSLTLHRPSQALRAV